MENERAAACQNVNPVENCFTIEMREGISIPQMVGLGGIYRCPFGLLKTEECPTAQKQPRGAQGTCM